MLELAGLRGEYERYEPRADRLRAAICEQLERLLVDQGITLGVPIESRVKSLESLVGKLNRKSLVLESLSALDDFVGVRLILLFRRDVDTVGRLISDALEVVGAEDTSRRLSETQFGYQSVHYVVRIPAAWRTVPTLADLGDLKAEIQVRTLAQHTWAAASHKLQYKQEANVPPPVRRTIHRVSALLETVDLELERVLQERHAYVAAPVAKDEPLNVDLVSAVLSELLPAENRDELESEPYSELLEELLRFGVTTPQLLRELLSRNLSAAMEKEAIEVGRRQREREYDGGDAERVERGVFFTHVGLARHALQAEFGEEFRRYLQKRARERMTIESNARP